LNVNQEDFVEDEDESEDEGANHMQLKESNDGDSSSSSGSYMADYRNFQFLQKEGKTGESSKHWSYSRDTKSLLLDTGTIFSCCNNLKMLVNVRKCKKSINGVSNGGVMVTDREGDLPGFSPSITILCH